MFGILGTSHHGCRGRHAHQPVAVAVAVLHRGIVIGIRITLVLAIDIGRRGA